MYVAVRELRAAKGRFALVGVVIGLIAFMTTLLSGLANGLVDDGISGLRKLPLSHLEFTDGAAGTFSRSTFTDAGLARWRDEAGGVAATPIGVSFANARTPAGTTIDLAVTGVDTDGFLIDDTTAALLAEQPGLVVNDVFADDGLAVGDLLTIVGIERDLPVLGFTDSGTYGHVDIAFTRLDTWQELLYGDNAAGRFSAIALRAEAGVTPTAAADTEVLTKTDAYHGSPGYTGETSTMMLIRGFLLVISALIVGAFFVVWTVQRSGQIALLKALGASRMYVIRDAVGQLVLVLVIAAALGGGVGYAVGGLIARTEVPFRLDPLQSLGALAALIVMGLLGCIAGIRRVTSVDPSLALRGMNG